MSASRHPTSATPVVGIGGGGHSRVVMATLSQQSQFCTVALLDSRPELQGQSIDGVPVRGGDEQLSKLRTEGIDHAFIGVGCTDSTAIRQRLWQWLIEQEMKVISVCAESASVSPRATSGHGATILDGARIQAGAVLGDNVVVNTGAVIEHDCRIGDHTLVASGAVLAGGVSVAPGVLIGVGACVRPGITIGRDCVVGAGAVVVKDVPPQTIVVGNPARPLHHGNASWTIQRAS